MVRKVHGTNRPWYEKSTDGTKRLWYEKSMVRKVWFPIDLGGWVSTETVYLSTSIVTVHSVGQLGYVD